MRGKNSQPEPLEAKNENLIIGSYNQEVLGSAGSGLNLSSKDISRIWPPPFPLVGSLFRQPHSLLRAMTSSTPWKVSASVPVLSPTVSAWLSLAQIESYVLFWTKWSADKEWTEGWNFAKGNRFTRFLSCRSPSISMMIFSVLLWRFFNFVVQLLSHVRLLAGQWTAAR